MMILSLSGRFCPCQSLCAAANHRRRCCPAYHPAEEKNEAPYRCAEPAKLPASVRRGPAPEPAAEDEPQSCIPPRRREQLTIDRPQMPIARGCGPNSINPAARAAGASSAAAGLNGMTSATTPLPPRRDGPHRPTGSNFVTTLSALQCQTPPTKRP